MIKWVMVFAQQMIAGGAFMGVMNATLSPVWGFIVIVQACTVILFLLIGDRLVELIHDRRGP